MQTAIQVICTGGTSLRKLIGDHDSRLEEFRLTLVAEKNARRNPGWMKIKGQAGIWGALNISWDTDTKTLTCRVVNKRYARPHEIIGRFVDFLLCYYSGRIKVISIFKV
jgi:hypothetical protein